MTLPVTNKVKFKADPSSVNYNTRYTPPMPENVDMNDVFVMQQAEQHRAEKKQNTRDRWSKANTIAQFGIAAGFISSAIIAFLALKFSKAQAAGKLDGLKDKSVLKFKEIAKGSVPELSSDSVNPKARDFIKMVKERTGMDEKLAKYTGSKSAEQCVLFHGPSGTGKTFSAKLMANELGAQYAEVDFPKIASPFVGQASKNINGVFADIAAKAKAEPNKKFLVAFNEIDSMLIPMEKSGTNQSYVLENRTAFLNGLDSIKEFENVKIVGTTNADPKSGNLDLAALSRFSNLFEVELPTKKEIVASLKWHLRDCEAAKDSLLNKKHERELEKFADELVKKHFSQRDVEKLAENAQTRFAVDIAKKSNPMEEKFDIKYLKEALKSKEFTTGSMNKKDTYSKTSKAPSFADLTFMQKLFLLFSKKS